MDRPRRQRLSGLVAKGFSRSIGGTEKIDIH